MFDSWLQARMDEDQDAVVLHIGCGMDSRVQRVGTRKHLWFDVDFPEVIQERRRYFAETGEYHMIAADVRDQAWISQVSEGKKKNAIIVMEGVSMYFRPEELQKLLRNLGEHFEKVHLFMDCYTVLAARATKYKNPINEVGVTETYGIDDPEMLADGTGMTFIKEHNLTPEELVRELAGMEQAIFRKVYAGKFAKKLYRLFEFRNI